MDGSGEAEKVKSFLENLSLDVPGLDTRVHLWQTLRKTDQLQTISANGNTKLYFTPAECNLSLENHEHAHMMGAGGLNKDDSKASLASGGSPRSHRG